MSSSFRKFAPLASLAVIAACSKSSKVTEDVLAQDSTLTRIVMNANRDSIAPAGDDSLSAAINSGPLSAPEPSVAAAPAPERQSDAVTKPAMAINQSSSRATRSRAAASIARRPGTIPSPRSNRRSSTKVSQPVRQGSAVVAGTQATRSTRVIQRREAANPRSTGLASTIPAGSDLELTSDNLICSSTSSVGDTFSARFAEDLVGPFGVVIPKGATATAEVFTKKNDSRTNSDSDVGVRIQSVTVAGRTYPVQSLVTSSDVTTIRRSRNDAGKVIGGAGLGAILGRVIGRDTRSTVIGAVGGAAAGAVVARQTGKSESCIPDGGRITARLTEPLRVASSE